MAKMRFVTKFISTRVDLQVCSEQIVHVVFLWGLVSWINHLLNSCQLVYLVNKYFVDEWSVSIVKRSVFPFLVLRYTDIFMYNPFIVCLLHIFAKSLTMNFLIPELIGTEPEQYSAKQKTCAYFLGCSVCWTIICQEMYDSIAHMTKWI